MNYLKMLMRGDETDREHEEKNRKIKVLSRDLEEAMDEAEIRSITVTF